MGEKGFRKTTVFSVKIAYYAVRPLAGRRPLTLDVPIPVDVRVACASISSGMVDAPSYREVVARPEAAQRAWGYVSRSSGIPVLHIDSILWVTGWAPRELPPGEARDMVASLLSRASIGRRPCSSLQSSSGGLALEGEASTPPNVFTQPLPVHLNPYPGPVPRPYDAARLKLPRRVYYVLRVVSAAGAYVGGVPDAREGS